MHKYFLIEVDIAIPCSYNIDESLFAQRRKTKMDESLKKRFFKNDILVTYPKKAEDKAAVLDYIMTFIDPNTTYSEIKLNFVLKKVCEDFPLIRRELVDNGYLIRDSLGKAYNVNPEKLNKE